MLEENLLITKMIYTDKSCKHSKPKKWTILPKWPTDYNKSKQSVEIIAKILKLQPLVSLPNTFLMFMPRLQLWDL